MTRDYLEDVAIKVAKYVLCISKGQLYIFASLSTSYEINTTSTVYAILEEGITVIMPVLCRGLADGTIKKTPRKKSLMDSKFAFVDNKE